jgi:putative membrane protein
MKKMFLLGTVVAVMLTACGKDDDNNTNNTTNATDRNFTMQASMGNRAEIAAGQLAVTKGANAMVRNFGQMMVTEHTQAQNDLRTRATNTGTSFMDTLSAEHAAMMQRLNGLSGRTFDTAYMNMQVMDHQRTINLYQTQISSGQHQSLKGYASQYLPGVQRHLVTADSIRTRL